MIKELASLAFVAVIVTWALIDLGSLLTVADAVVEKFVDLVREIARVAESSVT